MSNSKKDGLYRREDSPSIWASYTDASGRRVRRSTGTTDRKEAEAILAKWRLETHRTRTWGDEPTHTYDELMVRYLRETQPWKRAAERDLSIARVLQPNFSGAVMNTLSAKDIHSYIEARRRLGRKDSTIRRELGMLSAAINYARRQWEWNLPNPVMGRKPPLGENRVRWITPKEAARLIQAAKGNSRAPLLADFIELALHTGCRRDELLRLEWDRVDLAQRLIYLPSGKNKGKRNVSVPLNEAAMAILGRLVRFRKEHCKTSPWVFCHKDGERLQSVKKSFSTAVSKAGLKDFHIHDLRHTCAAWLVQAGVALVEVRELLRHTTVQVTEKYAHLNPQQSRNAVSMLDRMSRFGHAEGEVATTKAAKSLKKMVAMVGFEPTTPAL